MKQFRPRLIALLLAVLILLGALPQLIAAGGTGDPAVRLGTFSGDMLAGGGAQVQTDDGLFYLGETDGYIYNMRSGSMPVYPHRAARLNYADGVLYFARLQEDSFDLCSYDVAAKQEKVLLEGFAGAPGQIYLVEGKKLDFLWEGAVWELDLGTGEYRLVLSVPGLWSFVPTGCGMIYAVGSLFCYDLYAGRTLVVRGAENYYVDFGRSLLVYNLNGADYQMDLADTFRGTASPAAFAGEPRAADSVIRTLSAMLKSGSSVVQDEDEAAAAMDERNAEVLSEEENLPPVLEAPVDNSIPEEEPLDPADWPDDPEAPEPTEPEPTEPEPTEPAPTEPVPTEPAPTEPAPTEPASTEPAPTEPAPTEPAPTEPVPAEPAPTEPAPAEPELPVQEPGQVWNIPDLYVGQPAATPAEPELDDGQLRRPVSEGVQNILRRARQMTEIKWTPRQNVVGWKGRYVYQAGVTYTGLPYGQPVDASYVPWNTGLAEYISKVNNISSKMYTSYSNFNGQRAPYYSVDCSGFVSWALGLPSRTTTYYIESYCTRISSTSYADIQVGDILNNPISHVVLVTDVTYDESGAITSIEISESTPTVAYYGCCRSTRFTGSADLARFRTNYLGGGYTICRSNTRDNVTYTHECVVPLAEDICPLCSNGMFLRRGVDVSQWQTTIDWQTAAPYLNFAIIRMGYGLKADTQYLNNIRGCVANNVPYGLYLYGLATTPAEAREEAEFLLSNLGSYVPDLPIFYDVEELDGNLALPNDELLEVVTAFCSTIEAAGHRAGVYCSTYFWDTKMPDPAYNQWCRWVAHAASVMTCKNGGNLWQCTDNAYIPGIPTNVDLDYWFGPVGDMEHRYRSYSVSPTCTEAGAAGFACVACGHAVCKTVAPTGHFFSGGVCTVCGETQTLQQTSPFTDVHDGDWFAQAVDFVTERGLFSGVSATSFAPNSAMNRAMMVTVLWRLAGCPETTAEKLFSDVAPGSYYDEPVTWAAHLGIVNGTSISTYSPNQPITREQAAAFLYRYAGQLSLDRSARADLSAFPDAASLGDFAKTAMSWAVAEGLITGSNTVDGLLLLPKREATRAQIAMILMRFVRYLEEDARPLSVGVLPAEVLNGDEWVITDEELLRIWAILEQRSEEKPDSAKGNRDGLVSE